MAGENEGLLDQSEIEALFGGEHGATPSSSISDKGGGSHPGTSAPASAPAPAPSPPAFNVQPFQLPTLAPPGGDVNPADLSLILDVDLNVRVELGRTRMYIEEVLKLREGSIVPLEKLAGDPVDIFVNGQLLARGEVLVLNDNFCVRVSEILGESGFGRQAPPA